MSEMTKRFLNGSVLPDYVYQGQLGLWQKRGYMNSVAKALYGSMHSSGQWNPSDEGWSQTERQNVLDLDFSPNGSVLLAGFRGGQVSYFDNTSHKMIDTFDAHRSCVMQAVFFSPHKIGTCSQDGTAKLWDIRNTRSSTMTFIGPSGYVRSFGMSQKEDLMFSVHNHYSVCVWDEKNHANALVKLSRAQGILTAAISPDNTKMAIGCNNPEYIFIIHNLNLRKLPSWIVHPGFSTGMSNGRTSRRRKWNQIEAVKLFPSSKVTALVQFHHAGMTYALSRELSKHFTSCWTCLYKIGEPLNLHDDDEDMEEDTTQEGLGNTSPSGSERSQVIADRFKSRLIYHTQEGNEIPYIKRQGFSPDGRVIALPSGNGLRLLTFGSDFTDQIMNHTDRKPKRFTEFLNLPGHNKTVTCAKFAPHGIKLVSGCVGGNIVWHEPAL